jgi:hypothetical protein
MTATQDVAVGDGIMDFSEEHPKIPRFKIDGDVFECVPGLPVLSLIDFATMADEVSKSELDEKMRNLFIQMFNLLLVDESAELFIARLADKKRPITLAQANRLLPWVMEEYGLRPTEPSDSSSDSPQTPEPGLNSTASAQPTELTSADFASIAS